MSEQKPHDWDWVTARKACATTEVFERLREAARRNVQAMRVTTSDGRIVERFHFFSNEETFGVGEGSCGVRFYIRDGLIVAESQRLDPPVALRAVSGMDGDGVCRLFVGDEALMEWQFLQRALGQLFFGRR